jgi:hypothetical protein
VKNRGMIAIRRGEYKERHGVAVSKIAKRIKVLYLNFVC